jgi:hypothetical protein
VTLPIRIAVRVDLDDGSQHEYEVRTSDTAEPLPGFWPEGVVTRDERARMEYDRERDERAARLLAALKDALDGLEDMCPYVPDYFREKWDHQGYIDRAREALASAGR